MRRLDNDMAYLIRLPARQNKYFDQLSFPLCIHTPQHLPWWHSLKEECWHWRGFQEEAAGETNVTLLPFFLKTENMHNRGSLNHFLTVSAVRIGDPSGPRRLLSFLNHWRRVEAGWWSLHTNFTCPPTNTVAFSGNPGIRIGRETRISGGTDKGMFWTTTTVISL